MAGAIARIAPSMAIAVRQNASAAAGQAGRRRGPDRGEEAHAQDRDRRQQPGEAAADPGRRGSGGRQRSDRDELRTQCERRDEQGGDDGQRQGALAMIGSGHAIDATRKPSANARPRKGLSALSRIQWPMTRPSVWPLSAFVNGNNISGTSCVERQTNWRKGNGASERGSGPSRLRSVRERRHRRR